MKEKPIIVFNDSVKPKVIKALGFKTDKKSRLLDRNGKVVTSQSFESITSKEFGGMLQGSKIPIKKKESELVKYFISQRR
jgi:hypothetical protein